MKLITMSLSMVGFAASVFGSEAVQLASNGKTNYQIVIADDAAVQVRAAADDLVGNLEQVTGAEFPIVNASSAQGEHQILVGRSAALAKLETQIDWRRLGAEGFVIRTEGKRLVLVGGPRRGTINAVYSFLEEVVGCRWYTPKFSVIPNNENLSVGPLNIREVPVSTRKTPSHDFPPVSRPT
jgi:alpha-glucuronidase